MMEARYVAIWFTHLLADHAIRRRPALAHVPFVVAEKAGGRIVVKCASMVAEAKGIFSGMVVADCRAIMPELQVTDLVAGTEEKLLKALAEWCIRFTPVVAADMPDGLILDVSGCAHLWGGEQRYLEEIHKKISGFGYHIRLAMACTIGSAWAISRFAPSFSIVPPGEQLKAILPLPPAALRIDATIVEKLHKLGLNTIGSFIAMPRSALRRRFGATLLQQMARALGHEYELLNPVQPIEPYAERLPCMEPIRTVAGIEIAIQRLLEQLCAQLEKDGLGLRKCVLKCFRVDGNIQQVAIGTVRASRNVLHLFKLFELKIPSLTPDLGFELFVIEASQTEVISPEQVVLWEVAGHDETAIAELLDKIGGKIGADSIRRFEPDAHYWPERAYKVAETLVAGNAADWRVNIPRPLHILHRPEPIEVTVPIPDYPPMLFRYKGKLHNIKKADGPERIEQEWWLSKGVYRDYYCVEDEYGERFWLFRSGEYSRGNVEWYIHGFFV